MTTEAVWIITNGPARGGTHIAFRRAAAAQEACEGFTAQFGYPIIEDWADLSAANDGEILARYYEFNAGGAKIAREQRIERFPIVDS